MCSLAPAATNATAAAPVATGSPADVQSSAAEAASLSALLASASPDAAAASTAPAAVGSSDDAMTGILTVQRQQLRARIEQLEREAAVLRRCKAQEQCAGRRLVDAMLHFSGTLRRRTLTCTARGRITWSCVPS